MLSGWEWIVILGVAAIVILWGPAKIPELAKALGKAKGEFDKASKEYNKAAFETLTAKSVETKDVVDEVNGKSEDAVYEAAKKLGVATENKSKDQISTEVFQRLAAS